jgi:hypothetical protein
MSKARFTDRQAKRHLAETQFGTGYGPPLSKEQKLTMKDNLNAEIEKLGGCSGHWKQVYFEALLFYFYNQRTGQCFPSHEAIAAKAGCSIRTVQRALNWARDKGLLHWAHGLYRTGWRVLRTSNRYGFAAWLAITLPVRKVWQSRTNCQNGRRPPTFSLRES